MLCLPSNPALRGSRRREISSLSSMPSHHFQACFVSRNLVEEQTQNSSRTMSSEGVALNTGKHGTKKTGSWPLNRLFVTSGCRNTHRMMV